jgi:hypothetical protein
LPERLTDETFAAIDAGSPVDETELTAGQLRTLRRVLAMNATVPRVEESIDGAVYCRDGLFH